VSEISSSFAWSGDTIILTGTGLAGATVLVNGLPATITSQTSKRLAVTVPTIKDSIAGPVTVPVVISSPTGTASSRFTRRPTLELFKAHELRVNAEFGQGMDGSASATATLDRSFGVMLSNLTVRNTQTWSSLTVDMSTVWANADGTVIGFTTPDEVTSTGWMFHWPSGDTTASGDFSHVLRPNPGVAPFTRSAQIIMVRDHGAELLSTLSNADATFKMIKEVVSTLAPFI
jgi:hypothetical protein